MDDNEIISKLRKNILARAKSFVGIKEIPPNQSFNNKEFQNLMASVGWRTGWAWCCLFSELVWKLGYEDTFGKRADVNKLLSKLFSANSQATFLSFSEAPEFNISEQPEPADIGIYKSGNITGHTIIVADNIEYTDIRTVEGNASDKVNELTRKITGWGNYQLMGFIKPAIL
jgi:hypothetical protein